MSALLPIDAIELNINAEYGYSTREFSKVPNVYISNDYKSALFLVYHQTKPINNRIRDYRNHFALFQGTDSLIIVRTETSLIHTDNDATLEYDIITPLNDGCYRSTFKNWNVSFDKITYSSVKPETFANYTLIATGEWWFFDNGIILNGITGYRHNCLCESVFIYYELHVDHKISLPSKNSILSMPPVIEVVLKFGTPAQTTTVNTQNIPISTTQPQSLPVTSNTNNTFANIQTTTDTSTTTTTTTSSSSSTPQSTTTSNSVFSVPTFNLSSLSSTLLPNINASSRPIIRQNDVQTKFTKDIVNKSVLPSLYWFNARALELSEGCIDYFRPKDFIPCQTFLQKPNTLSTFLH